METLVRGRFLPDRRCGRGRGARTWPVIAMVLLGSALSLTIAATHLIDRSSSWQ